MAELFALRATSHRPCWVRGAPVEEVEVPRNAPRPTSHPWAVLHSFGVLYRLLDEGYRVLRDCPHTEAATDRERATSYFILHGIVEALGQAREALTLLADMEPCLGDLSAAYKDDLDRWTKFRDDTAHVIDRTHRVSRENQNNSVIREDEYGYDADTVTYDWDDDRVNTGISDSMLLRPAIDKFAEIFTYARRRVQEEHRSGRIKPPQSFRRDDG